MSHDASRGTVTLHPACVVEIVAGRGIQPDARDPASAAPQSWGGRDPASNEPGTHLDPAAATKTQWTKDGGSE